MQIAEYFSKKNFVPKIEAKPSEELNICVVIPSYNEPNLDKSLLALTRCKMPKRCVEVVVVVNHPEGSDQETLELSEQSIKIVKNFNLRYSNDKIQFFGVKAYNLPRKNAGVGLARQIGMDEAAYRLLQINNPNGIIACFDADAICMENYLVELENLWMQYPKTTACSIKYAHPTNGADFTDEIYSGIADYELHLRYYNQASRYIGFPFSYHTIGSSMASSAKTYIKFGGMNRHQAGEDFYFLQKIIPHGNFKELNSTCIFPSPRPSNRVPFGTGRAMLKYLGNKEAGITTYNLNSFLDLIPFFKNIGDYWDMNETQINVAIEKLPPPPTVFLNENNASAEIFRVKQNTANTKSFQKRFFLWFDAFMLLKYLNYVNEKFYTRQPVRDESIRLARLIDLPVNNASTIELLDIYRKKDAEEWSPII